MHAIPFPATLHRHLHEIDVFEVYNARLLFEGYNDEALRFARKYGSPTASAWTRTCPGRRHRSAADARLDGPEEVPSPPSAPPRCCAGRSRSPTCRAWKWVAQVKEKVR